MKICKHCGAKMNDDAKFCTSCGQPAETAWQSGQMNEGWNGGNAWEQTGGYQFQEQYQRPEYGNPYRGYPAPEKNSGMAIAALVLGLVGIGTGFLGAAAQVASRMYIWGDSYKLLSILLYSPGILAVVFGIIGIIQGGRPGIKGRGFAIAGLVVGIAATVFWIIVGQISLDLVMNSGGYYW